MAQEFSDESMADVGRALMEAIETYADKGWHPMDCPTEIVGDLHNEREELRSLIADIKAWDVNQYMTIPHELRERIEAALTHNMEVSRNQQRPQNDE